MERKVKWQVRFRTRRERLGVVSLYEEGYEGDIIELTGAAVPFETQEDSSDKWLEPIRKQTGYIRVLDEDNTEGIMPVGMKDRYVEYTEDGVLMWCGYMVPDVYSSDWDVTPMEVEFPVVGGLGVLEGVYLDENDGLGVVRLAGLIYDCLRSTGIDYTSIYIPREVTEKAGEIDYLFPLTLEVSRFNFFSENESLNIEDSDWSRYNGETCYDVLSEIMKFWGWTIRERGTEIWITSTVNTGSVKITMADLNALAMGTRVAVSGVPVDMDSYEISSFGLAGADHKKDILQGRKKVIVKGGVNPVGAVVPSVDKAKMKFVDTNINEYKTNAQTYAYEKINFYVPKEGYTDVKLYTYVKNGMTEIFDDWTAKEQEFSDISLYLGAYFLEQERVEADEYKKKKNWNLSETIRINLQDWTGDYPSLEKAKELPIVEMISRNVANYTEGAFVISAATRSIYQGLLADYDGNGKGEIEIRFRVGGRFWNGQDWVTESAWFKVQIGNEDDPSAVTGTGKIISTKTLDMPYNGADGYVMPIGRPLSGEVELTIHAMRNWSSGGYSVLMLDNLKVDYYGVDMDQKKSDESENRYARTTGMSYTAEEEISLKMATNNNNKAGHGILSLQGANIEKMYFLDKEDRPEMHLVNKGVSLYGRNTEKLTLNLDKVNANPHDLMLWDGKKYLVASEAVNWAEESGQYIIMEVGE